MKIMSFITEFIKQHTNPYYDNEDYQEDLSLLFNTLFVSRELNKFVLKAYFPIEGNRLYFDLYIHEGKYENS
jgi:hypothetical protein